MNSSYFKVKFSKQLNDLVSIDTEKQRLAHLLTASSDVQRKLNQLNQDLECRNDRYTLRGLMKARMHQLRSWKLKKAA
jgi:hypothetical protein